MSPYLQAQPCFYVNILYYILYYILFDIVPAISLQGGKN